MGGYMVELIASHEEYELFEQLQKSYEKIYEGVKFGKEEKVLSREDIGEIYYTYPGEEGEATFQEKVRAVDKALKYGYNTPVILLRKKDKLILVDGHRRLNVAWKEGLSWKALILVPDKEITFRIEKFILGKIKDIW